MELLLSHGPALIFWFLAIVAVATALLVVTSRSPVHSALFLLVTFSTVAGLFILKGAEFVGAVQLMVYSGGIMVLFLFVIMLVRPADVDRGPVFQPGSRWALLVSAALLVLVMGAVAVGVRTAPLGEASALAELRTVPPELGPIGFEEAGDVVGNSRAVGQLLYGRFLVPFEVASILLLVAILGAIIMGKERLESDHVEEAP